jgi:hypothetical protein
MSTATETHAFEALGLNEPAGLLAVPEERADAYLEARAKNPRTVAELLRGLLGADWAASSQAARVAAVSEWLGTHKPRRMLALDLEAQGLAHHLF